MQEARSGGALLRPQASPWAAGVSMRGCVCRCVGGGEDSQQSRFSPPETHRLPPFLDFTLTGFTTMQSDSDNYFYFLSASLCWPPWQQPVG